MTERNAAWQIVRAGSVPMWVAQGAGGEKPARALLKNLSRPLGTFHVRCGRRGKDEFFPPSGGEGGGVVDGCLLNGLLRPTVPEDAADQERALVEDLLFALLGVRKGNFLAIGVEGGAGAAGAAGSAGGEEMVGWQPALRTMSLKILDVAEDFAVVEDWVGGGGGSGGGKGCEPGLVKQALCETIDGLLQVGSFFSFFPVPGQFIFHVGDATNDS